MPHQREALANVTTVPVSDSVAVATVESLRDFSLELAERCDAWLEGMRRTTPVEAPLRDAQLARIADEVARSFGE